jgi:hypothetical protein
MTRSLRCARLSSCMSDLIADHPEVVFNMALLSAAVIFFVILFSEKYFENGGF